MIVRVPIDPTPEQIEIGRAVIEAEMAPDYIPGEAARIARDIYREMVAARPPVPEIEFANLTATQARAFVAIRSLTEALGRYPTCEEIGEDCGLSKRGGHLRVETLTKMGYIRRNGRGEIRWIKPLDETPAPARKAV